MWRRLPANIALAVVMTVIILYGVMWTTAIYEGHVQLISRHYATPEEFRGNHGPWRQHVMYRGISSYASIMLGLGMPMLLLAGYLDPCRRTAIIGCVYLGMFVIDIAHFPLFD